MDTSKANDNILINISISKTYHYPLKPWSRHQTPDIMLIHKYNLTIHGLDYKIHSQNNLNKLKAKLHLSCACYDTSPKYAPQHKVTYF